MVVDADNYTYWEMRALEGLKELHVMPHSNETAIEKLAFIGKLIALSMAKRQIAQEQSNESHT